MELNLINLKVRDWDKMVRFYQEVMGLPPAYLEPEDKYGQLDAGNIRLSLSSGGELPVSGSSRLTIQFQVNDLLAEIIRLESLGCEFFDKQLDTGEAYRMAQFRDPEGNAIAIYELMVPEP